MTMTPVAAPSSGIVLDGLRKTFTSPAGPVRAVDDVSIDIAPGETVALLGPNGAGKSTTIDMLLGLTAPDTGAIRIFGQVPEDAIKAGAIGAMLQVGGLIRFVSVRELLTMVAALYPNPLAVDEVMTITGTTDVAERRTDKLSGGQTQRVRAAMALVSNPDLLVLDEPTVAMDVEGRHIFWESVRSFAQAGKTVLFATHYLDEADQYADRIILMARGRVVADGPANEIKAIAGQRTIRATVPSAGPDDLRQLPGVSSVDRRGEAVVLSCSDSDAAIRGLLDRFADARDIEISAAGLEAAFLALTGEPHDDSVKETTP